MISRAWVYLLVGLGGLSALPAMAAERVHTQQSQFRIPYHSDPAELARLGAREVRLYVSRDNGASWELSQSVAPTTGRFTFQSPTDGEYWFAVRTVDTNGRLFPASDAGLTPGLKVVVDTQRPVLQLSLTKSGEEVRLAWRAQDVDLSVETLVLEVRQAGESQWRALRVAANAQGETRWPAPKSGVVSVRGRVLDKAGNEGVASQDLGMEGSEYAPLPARPDLEGPIAGRGGAGSMGPTDETLSVADSGTTTEPKPLEEPQPLVEPKNDGVPSQLVSQSKVESPPVTEREPVEAPTQPAGEAVEETDGDLAEIANTDPAAMSGDSAGAEETRAEPENVDPPADVLDAGDAIVDGGGADGPVADGKEAMDAEFDEVGASEGEGSVAENEGTEGVVVEDAPLAEAAAMAAGAAATSESATTATDMGPTSTTPAGTASETAEGGSATEPPVGKEVRAAKYVKSPKFELGYQVEEVGPSGVGAVDFFITEDDGRKWYRYGTDEDRESPFGIEVPREGIYGFTMRVRNGVGVGAAPPRPGEAPDFSVVVDATPPVVVIETPTQHAGTSGPQLRIRWQTREAHPAKTGAVDLAYSETADGPWTAIAEGLEDTGQFEWVAQGTPGGRMFLRALVRDAAGNVGQTVTSEPMLIDWVRPSARITDVEVRISE